MSDHHCRADIKGQYGLADLKELAKNDILSKLSPANILPELFSDFASRCAILCMRRP